MNGREIISRTVIWLCDHVVCDIRVDIEQNCDIYLLSNLFISKRRSR